MKGGELSHEEIWDDSALQESWDDALKEYKKYHSLAATGEKVEFNQINGETEMKVEPKSAANTKSRQQKQPATSDTTATQPSHTTPGAHLSVDPPTTAPAASASTVPPAPASTAQNATAAMPQALLNSMQDEGMKNLMMSWYYAGYYTGLLEGQQKAFASMQATG